MMQYEAPMVRDSLSLTIDCFYYVLQAHNPTAQGGQAAGQAGQQPQVSITLPQTSAAGGHQPAASPADAQPPPQPSHSGGAAAPQVHLADSPARFV